MESRNGEHATMSMTPGALVVRVGYLLLCLFGVAGLGCRAPVLTVDDAVVFPGANTRLGACVEREPILGLCKDVERVRVAFDVEGREVGDAKTNQDGVAEVEYELAPGLEQYEARTLVDGRELRTPGRVFTWDKDRVIIAVDIDHTIARTDYKGLLRTNSADGSEPVEHSPETLNMLARDFHIIYLTGRPRFMIDKTRVWLRERGYPAGPVITSVRVRDMANPGAAKLRTLSVLRKWWPNLLIGIGNRAADAEAYSTNDMLSLVLPSKPGESAGHHAVVLPNWKAVDAFFTANREVLTDAARLKEAIAGREMLLRTIDQY